jgi:hypothetical protein
MPGDFDQLVEGPWPISTSCPPVGLCGGASAFWRENWLIPPPVLGSEFGSAGRRPSLEDPPRFRDFGPMTCDFRPIDEVASPAAHMHSAKRGTSYSAAHAWSRSVHQSEAATSALENVYGIRK